MCSAESGERDDTLIEEAQNDWDLGCLFAPEVKGTGLLPHSVRQPSRLLVLSESVYCSDL